MVKATLSTRKKQQLEHKQQRSTADKFVEIEKISIQGGALKTCSLDQEVRRCTVFLKTGGCNLSSNVELWQGPYNTPQTISVYLEDGNICPFRATIETPGGSNSVGINNNAPVGFPITTGIEVDRSDKSVCNSYDLIEKNQHRLIEVGIVDITPFSSNVQSVRVSLQTDGHPLHARVEILDGRKRNKQIMEIYTEDGLERPFNAIIETPGSGNIIRIINTAPGDFPVYAYVGPHIVGDDNDFHSGNVDEDCDGTRTAAKTEENSSPFETANEQLPIMEFELTLTDDEGEVYICDDLHP